MKFKNSKLKSKVVNGLFITSIIVTLSSPLISKAYVDYGDGSKTITRNYMEMEMECSLTVTTKQGTATTSGASPAYGNSAAVFLYNKAGDNIEYGRYVGAKGTLASVTKKNSNTVRAISSHIIVNDDDNPVGSVADTVSLRVTAK